LEGTFDILTLFWLVSGLLLLFMGLKNYKSQKEKFGARYVKYEIGISFLLLGFARIFTTKATPWVSIPIVLIFFIFNMLIHIRNKKIQN